MSISAKQDTLALIAATRKSVFERMNDYADSVYEFGDGNVKPITQHLVAVDEYLSKALDFISGLEDTEA